MVSGRTAAARDVARFVPECVVLFRRLLADDRVPRSRKVLLGVLLIYLITPIDLVPDFIPIAGQADDAILVVLVLRAVLRASGERLLREHWPGSERSLLLLLRLACDARKPASSSEDERGA
jgi:uncharacterized membrane protein YkvA (DUF1232 family)